MIVRRFYNDQLAQASYLVGSAETGEALIVDPNREIAQYQEAAQRESLRITAVTETHIHADFVSGTRELAAATGARVYLSDAGPQEWTYTFAEDVGATLLREGDFFMVGKVRVDVRHTPGHTPEHLSFLVTDILSANEPMGIFTGDFVFVGDVGRPDLLEKAAGIANTMEAAARDLYHSLQRFRDLPDYLQIWPGHGAGSACGRSLGAVPQSTVGYEKRYNWAFGELNEVQFIEAVLEGQPEAPPYFAQMKRVNKVGPALLSDIAAPRQNSLEQLIAALEAHTLVVDTRSADAFAAGHVPGTINVPFGNAFLNWAGWLLSYDTPCALIADAEAVNEIIQQVRLIGFDAVDGYWTEHVLDAWQAAGRTLATLERVAPAAAATQLARGDVVVLDVRNPSEHNAGHIAGSKNIPLGMLQHRFDELPTDRPILVHCQGGTRSAIAAGLLAARGRSTVMDLQGGFGHWQAAGNPVERGVPDNVQRLEQRSGI